MHLVSLILALAMGMQTSPSSRAATIPPRGPAIPVGIDEYHRAALNKISDALSKGRPDLAQAGLKGLTFAPTLPVYIDWAPVPTALRPAYRKAAETAMAGWNAVGTGQFKVTQAANDESAGLIIVFEKYASAIEHRMLQAECISTQLEGDSPGRRGRLARIGLLVPETNVPHTQASVAHLVAQAIGMGLGLAPDASSLGVMGGDQHVMAPAARPTAAEVALVRQLRDARAKLASFAAAGTRIYLPRAILSIENEEANAGDVQRGEKAHFEFKVTNKGDSPLEIDVKPGCGCTVAEFDHQVAPGKTGRISATLDTTGMRGRIAKSAEVHTNDPDRPTASIRLIANVPSAIAILPAESAMVSLVPDQAATQEFDVHTSGANPPEVTAAVAGSAYTKAELVPVAGTGQGHSYKLKLTFSPDMPFGRTVVSTTLRTTAEHEPTVNVTAICDKGIVTMPSSAYLGSITPATSMPVRQVLTLSKPGGSFHITGVQSTDPKLEATFETVKEGSQYRVSLRYAGGWSAGPIRAKVMVATDDPKQPSITIPINGVVANEAK